MKPQAIDIHYVSKIYTIHHEKPTLVEKFVRKKNEKFTAINNLSLSIAKGERIGLIGPNGSGKTTLLKLIAGITLPTLGTILVNGKIISLIDLEAGFHPDLTGYQNIFLNGMLLGMGKKYLMKNCKNIIQFADIKQFIDAPMYTYSSGMTLRLGFAVAIYSQPDILVLDEHITVGDNNFKHKAQHWLETYFKAKNTIIIASHDIDYIRYNCTRIVTLDKGAIISDKKNSPKI